MHQSTEPLPVKTAASALSHEIPISAQQLALIRTLDKLDESLSAMYQGGINVLVDTSNPDRFAQSAHSIRELMEKIPERLDVPVKAQKESLKTKVINIKDAYVKMKMKTGSFMPSKGRWEGNIDMQLSDFLLLLGSFFEWFVAHHPRRRDEIDSLLVQLDGSGRALPKPLALLNIKEWDKKRDYFQSVSHHREIADGGEFHQCLDALELFLLDRLEPRTFDDFSEIDALLEEVGENAKS
ncbi:MAG: hypothetical protein WCI01_08290 [Chlorobiaceae bacterium]